MVDNEEDFVAVFNKFVTWLEDRELLLGKVTDHNMTHLKTFMFITCGDWDLKYMLPSQCSTSHIKMPNYFLQWINIKKSFAMCNNGKFPRSLSEMLNESGLTFQGRQHSGIDDVKNIARIVQTLAKEKRHVFEITAQIKS